MGIRFGAAKATGSLLTWGLRDVLHRNGRNTPGKIALYLDPDLIGHLSSKVKHSICVVGTNGKTTVNNLIADVFEAAGKTVVCNRDGANLDSGVATALLQGEPADWGVFESDELWLVKTLPQLQSDYVLLLNLFRDQLDRCGEIDHIQTVIADALRKSPNSTLIYNGDDPQCAIIAEKVNNPKIAFGIEEDLHLPQNTVSDAQMCQLCEGIMDYGWRQYGQLGTYSCPNCHFKRPPIDFSVTNATIGEEGSSFSLTGADEKDPWTLRSSVGAAYMVYNLAAVGTVARLAGCGQEATQHSIDVFAPNNGRLQKLVINGHDTLLNLAKNPTGFNQNLKLVTQGESPRVVAFFINDREADGHDISWLWDIDFEELAAKEDLAVFAGGMRANDMQVRLRYAGIDAGIVGSASDLFEKTKGLPADVRVYLIANYTALPEVKADLERLAAASVGGAAAGAGVAATSIEVAAASAGVAATSVEVAAASAGVAVAAASEGKPCKLSATIPVPKPADQPPVVIAHMFPDLLNLYGDGGNVTVLQRRLQWRGIPVEVRAVPHGQRVDLSGVDLVFLGGGPDREQRMASVDLAGIANDLREYVEEGGPLLAICGGYQILGMTWLLGDEVIPGLGILGIRTGRVEGGSTNRLIDNIALSSVVATNPVVGFENHAGRTYLDEEVTPFGRVISNVGHGNNDDDKADGVLYKNVVGTYLHGPLLGKNPEVADFLLQKALNRCGKRNGVDLGELGQLDDRVELAANRVMAERLHARSPR